MCRRPLAAILATLAMVACAPAANPSASGLPTDSPVAQVSEAACDSLTTPMITGPDGSQVVLSEGPTASVWETNGDLADVYLRQIGDCVWIVGYVPMDGEAPFLTAFHGRLGSDLRIVGTFADLTGELVPGHNHGDAVFRITFEGDDVVLVEDRSATGPPGCFGGDGPCPEPTELRRAEP